RCLGVPTRQVVWRRQENEPDACRQASSSGAAHVRSGCGMNCSSGDPFSHHHAAARLRTRDPFATLVKLPKERGIPSTYALGIKSTLTQPGEDTRVGTAGRIVVKGRVMRMVPD
ncbi:unnamed protein product, partial [Scytosiphon promiscuus]